MLIFMFNINSFYSTDVLKLHYWCFFYKINFKKNQKLISYNFNNSIIRKYKFLLVYWSRIISLFLKVLRKLIYEAHWVWCLLHALLLNFFMNWALNVSYVLLNSCKHFHTKTLFYLLSLCPCLDLGIFLPYLYVICFSISSSFSLWLFV